MAAAAAHGLLGAPAVVGAAGFSAFKYNRMNYLFDQGLRYTRFTAGYNMALEQADMYREDIRDLTALTVMKQDRIHSIGGVFFVNVIQLIMAGRLGVHGPAPSGWLLGIYWCNSTFALLFLVMTMWLAYHASARAQAGGVHMLTQSTRLPIPSPQQLDKARAYGNDFEKQRMGDMFRVPFVTPAPHEEPVDDSGDELASQSSKGKKPRGKSGFAQRRIPVWACDEKRELHGGEGGAKPAALDGRVRPEHFELYRSLQHEWWAHDVYSRVALFYCYSYWFHAVSMYIQCHCFTELRALWPAWSCTIIFVTAHYGLLRMDIIPSQQNGIYEGGGFSFGVPMELVAPLTPLFTCAGMTLDYSIIEASDGWRAIIYFFGWCALIIHFLWALRTLDLMWPRKLREDMPDVAGKPWWPKEWYLPTAFHHALYVVAPPRHADPGQTCLQQEMKASKGPIATELNQVARESEPNLFAFRILRGGVLSTIFIFAMVICGRVVETANGERKLLKQEGRVERWPSHMQPWISPWTRTGERNEWSHTGGSDRRLSQRSVDAQRDRQIAQVVERLIPVLGSVSDKLEQPEALPSRLTVSQTMQRVHIAWPQTIHLVQPSLLACQGNSAVILNRRHSGALFAGLEVGPGETSMFVLSGLDGLGETVGALWSAGGLMLATSSGSIAECPGLPNDGIWICQDVNVKLPTGGGVLESAVVTRVPTTHQFRAALAFQGEPAITIFDYEEGMWMPAGEVQLPFSGSSPPFSMAADGNEVLVSMEGGSVLAWPVGAPEPAAAALPPASSSNALAWQASCALDSGRLARLALQQVAEAGWTPEIFMTEVV